MLSTEVSSAICVQRFDDSRNSAIHTTYRISLRSSSMREPRYPLLRVVFCLWSRRPFGQTRFRFSLVVLFGLCGLDRGWPAAHSRLLPGGRRGREGVPLVPHPPTRGPNECFPARGQSLVGAWPEGAYGWFAVWLLIDSMILPQVHLRNGEALQSLLCDQAPRCRGGPTIS
jgi:hypothetical protein